jgi:hypothetical protein
MLWIVFLLYKSKIEDLIKLLSMKLARDRLEIFIGYMNQLLHVKLQLDSI